MTTGGPFGGRHLKFRSKLTTSHKIFENYPPHLPLPISMQVTLPHKSEVNRESIRRNPLTGSQYHEPPVFDM